MIVFILSGCQEVENAQYANEVNNIEIEEDVNFSDIYAPEEVYIYSAKFWEQEDEVIIDTFMDGGYDKTEMGAFGKSYFSASDTKNEKVLVLMDEGMAWFGRRELYNMKGGFNFSYCNSFYTEGLEECWELEVEYCNRNQISDNKPDEKDSIFVECFVSNSISAVNGYLLNMYYNCKKEIVVYKKSFSILYSWSYMSLLYYRCKFYRKWRDK